MIQKAKGVTLNIPHITSANDRRMIILVNEGFSNMKHLSSCNKAIPQKN